MGGKLGSKKSQVKEQWRLSQEMKSGCLDQRLLPNMFGPEALVKQPLRSLPFLDFRDHFPVELERDLRYLYYPSLNCLLQSWRADKVS